jgi:hypothetical protein
MGRIYGRARTVHVWLGEESNGIRTAFDNIEAFNEIFEFAITKLRRLESHQPILPIAVHIFECQLGPPELAALTELFERPWFFRA